MIAIMKNTYRSLIISAAALLVLGCTDMMEGLQRDYSIRLEVSADDVTVTRATQAGVDSLNENLIKTLDYFLYPAGDTTSNATFVGRIAPNASNSTNVEAVLAVDMFTTLFPSDGAKCEVYAIANLPAGATIPANTKLSDLRAIVIGTSFKNNQVQESFVMTSLGQIQRIGNSATGSIGLKRVASKFSLQASVVDKYVEDRPGTDPDITWTPMPENMTVVMKNFADTSNVGGTVSAAKGLGEHKKRSFKKMTGTGCTYTEGGSTFTKYYVDTLWYSYPRTWTDASEATSFLITLPWKRPVDPLDPSAGDKYQKCYYKILLNEDVVGSNKWYNIIAELKVLGSFYEESPTLVLPDDLDYTVLDWMDGISGSSFNTNAAIKDAGYLTVSSNSYALDNVNSISIPFSSSEDCEATCSCTYMTFSGNSTTDNTLATSKYSVEIVNNTVVLTHNLVNEMTQANLDAGLFDYSVYHFVIDLYHKGNHSYHERITVDQKPALVITGEANTADAGHNTKYTVIVNGNRTAASAWYNVTSTGSWANPYMYIVEVSRTDDYIIGDPRSTTANNDVDLGMSGTSTTNATKPTSVEAPAFYKEGNYYSTPNNDSKRELMYYYPTNNSSETNNMLAPKFKIASAQSNCNSYQSDAQQVRWRCATYQEFGSPAGRWRVPTAAEIKIIGTLCANGLLPTIFSNDAYYWAADGVYQYKSGSFTKTTQTKALSRCVYDEWYWEQSDYAKLSPSLTGSNGTYGTFVWGDMPRENFK